MHKRIFLLLVVMPIFLYGMEEEFLDDLHPLSNSSSSSIEYSSIPLVVQKKIDTRRSIDEAEKNDVREAVMTVAQKFNEQYKKNKIQRRIKKGCCWLTTGIGVGLGINIVMIGITAYLAEIDCI